MIGFTKALAREVASRQITVNAVAPGFVPTALTNDLPEDLVNSILKSTPMGRMVRPKRLPSPSHFWLPSRPPTSQARLSALMAAW